MATCADIADRQYESPWLEVLDNEVEMRRSRINFTHAYGTIQRNYLFEKVVLMQCI